MHKIVEFVDKIYCINLDVRRDRWIEVVSRFEKVGIADHVIRFSAEVDEDPRIGCRNSHIQCVNNAIENDYQNILIFEDDVVFIEENVPNFEIICNFLAQDKKWELFYLGGVPMFPASFLSQEIFRSRFFSTHAYLVNHRAYKKILQAGSPIDIWYSQNMLSYGLSPLYAVQGAGYSDIRKEELMHKDTYMQRRYNKLVYANSINRWWYYFDLHYLSRFLRKRR